MRTVKVYKYKVSYNFGYFHRVQTEVMYLRAMDHDYFQSLGLIRLDDITYEQLIKEYV